MPGLRGYLAGGGMKPYFEEDGITIYHGDCREVLPGLDPVDLVLTDPPYNCGKDYGPHNDSMSEGEYAEWARGRVELCLRAAPKQFWVAPRYKLRLWMSLLPETHLVVIRRGANGPWRSGGWLDQFEIALASYGPASSLPDLWEGIRLKGEGYFFREEWFGHPGYTPSAIFRRALHAFQPKTAIDPFSGTGTSLYCAKHMGIRAIGVELNERYCEIAAKRLSQAVLPLEAA